MNIITYTKITIELQNYKKDFKDSAAYVHAASLLN